MATEQVIFTIDKEGNLRFEYKGKAGPGCVEEIQKILRYVGPHSIIDEGHTGDYYKSSLEQQIRRGLF